AEIETDKATMEVEAPEDGVIEKLLLAAGTEHVPVNHPIAMLLTEDEAQPQAAAPPSPLGGEGVQEASAAPDSISVQKGEGPLATEQVMHKIAEQIRRNGGNGHVARIFASPLARRLAREAGIELAALNGSGPHGRIVRQDVERAATTPKQAERIEVVPDFEEVEPAEIEQAPEPRPQELVTRHEPQEARGLSDRQVLALYEPGSYEIAPHDTMRRFIAERLTLSKQTIPHFYLAIDCQLDALMAARARMNALAPQEGPRAFKLSLNDFIVKALAMALQTVPAANATWTEAGLLRHRASDIAVAVALEGGGLHTPVIRDAEIKSLSEISNEMRDLAARARSKRLAPHEYQGGSTTISNLGMYGIDRFDAVINPPQASIMAVGRAEKRAVVKDDALKIATMMSVTLSVDHRVIDGALGAELLAAFKAYIEDPVTMLV
ncbi:MAG: 2-oxo acid dehydrogenase subunit E2, partial [Methyloceanibacter sp.]